MGTYYVQNNTTPVHSGNWNYHRLYRNNPTEEHALATVLLHPHKGRNQALLHLSLRACIFQGFSGGLGM